MNDFKRLVGKKIAQLRAAKRPRMTQADLAEKLGVETNTVWRWESGKSLPEGANLQALAMALGTTPSRLIDIEEKKKDRPPIQDIDNPTFSDAAAILEKLASLSPLRRRAVLAILFGNSSLAPDIPAVIQAVQALAIIQK